MNLVVFCPYYPPHVGGLETHAADFNSHMSQRPEIKQITVFAPRLPRDSKTEETKGTIRIVRFPAFEVIPNFPMPRFWLREYWRLYRMISFDKESIVISRTRFFFTSVMAWWFARRRRLRYLHIEHGSDYVQLSNRFFSFVGYCYDHTLGRLVLCMSDQNIAISEAVKSFIRIFDKREVPVIYRGVNSELIESTHPDGNFVHQFAGKVSVIFVGRLIDGKGVKDLIDALARLKNKKVVALIVGDGPQRANLEEQTRSLGLTDAVRFMGQQSLERAIGLVKACDIFVSPSYTEGLPSSVIEAALCRRCIIATDVGGTPEIIEDQKSGFLVPPRDVAALVRCLEKSITDLELRKKLGQIAYESAKQRFSWDRTCDTYINVFRNLLQSNNQKTDL